MGKGNLIEIPDLYEKDIYAKEKTNVRSLPSMETGTILKVIDKGNRIGKVYSHVEGFKKSRSEKDGSMWLMMYSNRINPITGKKAYDYVKLFPDMLDRKSLEEQGVKTVEEKQEEKDEKEKGWLDKLMTAGKWVLAGWVAVELLKTTGKKNVRVAKA